MYQDQKGLNILDAFVSSRSLCMGGKVFAAVLLPCGERELSARILRRSHHACDGAHATSHSHVIHGYHRPSVVGCPGGAHQICVVRRKSSETRDGEPYSYDDL